MHFKLTRQRGSAWVRRKREVLQQISVKDFNLLLPQWAVFESIESHLEGCSSSKLVIDLLIPRTRHHRLRAWLVCFDRCENQQVLQVPVLASLRSIASGASRYKNIRREKKTFDLYLKLQAPRWNQSCEGRSSPKAQSARWGGQHLILVWRSRAVLQSKSHKRTHTNTQTWLLFWQLTPCLLFLGSLWSPSALIQGHALVKSVSLILGMWLINAFTVADTSQRLLNRNLALENPPKWLTIYTPPAS